MPSFNGERKPVEHANPFDGLQDDEVQSAAGSGDHAATVRAGEEPRKGKGSRSHKASAAGAGAAEHAPSDTGRLRTAANKAQLEPKPAAASQAGPASATFSKGGQNSVAGSKDDVGDDKASRQPAQQEDGISVEEEPGVTAGFGRGGLGREQRKFRRQSKGRGRAPPPSSAAEE